MKLADLVEKMEGVIVGNGTVEILGLAGLADASQGDLSFLANSKYSPMLATTTASAVLVNEDWQGESACAVVRVKSPDQAMAIAASVLGPSSEPDVPEGVHSTSCVSDLATVDATVSVGPHCVVEAGAEIGAGTVLVAGCYVGRDAVIGQDCIMYSNAVVRERVIIGNRVILHEGSVIGGDGFGNYMENGAWHKIPHIGTVEIGDDSEIGINSAVDRARFGKTVVGKGVKIDNLVMLGHNVQVGDHSAMAAQVGISGSTVIGKYVMLGGQAGLAGHLKVGDGAVLGAQSGILKNVDPGLMVTGTPALPFRQAAVAHFNLSKLGDWKAKVKTLEKKLAAMEEKMASYEARTDTAAPG